MISTTTAPATKGIGWSNGIACQVSLPNISVLRRWLNRRARGSSVWARAGRKLLIHNRVEQSRINRAVGEGTHVAALLAKREITRSVQGRSGLACPGNPLRKRVLGYGMRHEVHVGKTVAAKLRRLAIKLARLVGS